MPTKRIVRQVVQIPRDLELSGHEALLRKEGERLIVEPLPRPSLLQILSTWEPLEEEFPDVDDLQPLEAVNL